MQLVLGAATVTVAALATVISPWMFGIWHFTVGVVAIVAITMAVLAIPWARRSQSAVLAVPFLDALAIGFVASNTELRLSYLWILPVTWVALYFDYRALIGILALIGAILFLDFTLKPEGMTGLRVFVVGISLLFTGITARSVMRQTRALRRLLRREAGRLNRTLARRSAQERRTTEILNAVDVGVMRISRDGQARTVNEAYVKLYGLDPLDTSLPARSIEYTALRGMPMPPSERPFSRAARGETFSDARVWLYTADGAWRVLSVSAKALSTADREESGMLLIAQDVTVITHAERERERLSAIASHELRHPLTTMIGHAELALEVDELTPRLQERFEAILRASERMLEMADNMLTGSRPAFSGRETYDDVDLRNVISESVASFRPTARARDITIDLLIETEIRAVVDEFRIRQVIDNLVSNAVKYTPGGGTVSVEAGIEGDSVAVTVSDTGIGISAEDLPKIMTPYFRAEDAKETAGGTGLGLGITHTIISEHGGTIVFDSEPGEGTTATVRLPRARAEARTREAIS